MRIETDDLLNATEVAEVLGLSHRTAVATYRSRYAPTATPFPEPILSKGTCVLWARDHVEAWAKATGRRG